MPKKQTKSKPLSVRIGRDLRKKVDRYAAARGMSVGEFVRYALWTYMDQTPERDDDDAGRGVQPLA